MSDEININNNEQLEVIVEKIEKKIIAKYKNKFIGLIVGVGRSRYAAEKNEDPRHKRTGY